MQAFTSFLTANQAGRHPSGEDETSVVEVKRRLKAIMRAMAISGSTPILSNEIDELVKCEFVVKPVVTNASWFNHCKTVCVDRRLLYIGSDNTYPIYTEGHGCWIEDEKTIEAWFQSFLLSALGALDSILPVATD